MFDISKFRVYLRGLEFSDVDAITTIRREPEVIQGFSSYNTFASSENERKWVESRIFNKDAVSTAICLKETNELIGCIFLTDIDMYNKSAHCPIFISSKFHCKGYATEARILMLNYAFQERAINRIEDYVLEDNVASLNLHFKCGYAKEGLLRQRRFKKGKLVNEYILSCIKDDFEKIIER